MPAFFGLGADNPVAWANFHRKGGVRTAALTSGAYFLLLGGLIFLSTRMETRNAARAYGAWTGGLLGLQFLFAVVIGAGRLSATIRGDLTSGMSESLRLMPLPARHAVLGYMTATATTLGGFFLANLLLGLVVMGLSELPAARWLAANAILFAFAAFVWTVAAFLAFGVKTPGGLLAVVSLVGVFGQAGLLLIAPGLVVLAGPLIGQSIFNLRTAQTEVAAPLIVSIAAQFVVGAIFFAGAARKFRRPDALALGGWLAVGLLLAWVAVSLLAIHNREVFHPSFMGFDLSRDELRIGFVGSTVMAMLVALAPLSNFARLHVEWARGRADDPALRRRVPPPAVAGVLVALVVGLMLFALPEPPKQAQALFLLSAVYGFCMSAIYVAELVYRVATNAKAVLAIWLVLYCLIPLAADLVRSSVSDKSGDPVLQTMSSFSPVGMVIVAVAQEREATRYRWDYEMGRPVKEVDLRWGAGFHVLVPLLLMVRYARLARRPERNAR